jgi:hypothetical protein
MRTKIALLSAALVAAGVASSMAQSNVYSLNVVGYVNINVTPGYNLITLPLQGADVTSSVNSVLTNSSPVPIPTYSTVYVWNPSLSKYDPSSTATANGDTTWGDVNGNTPTNTYLPPGRGFFVNIPSYAQQQANGDPGASNITITVVGTVLQGTNSYPIVHGYDFYGDFEPVATDLSTNGWPVNTYDNFGTWDQVHHKYIFLAGSSAADNGGGTNTASFSDQNGDTQPAIVNVGQGFIYQSALPGTFTQVFTVQ